LYLLAWSFQEETYQTWHSLLSGLGHSSDGKARPLSCWRLIQWSLRALEQTLLGGWFPPRFETCLLRLQRFLRDSPRKRGKQTPLIPTGGPLRLAPQRKLTREA